MVSLLTRGITDGISGGMPKVRIKASEKSNYAESRSRWNEARRQKRRDPMYLAKEAKYMRDLRANNPAFRARSLEYMRSTVHRRNHALTDEQFELLKVRFPTCGICGQDFLSNEGKRGSHGRSRCIDHDHLTGTVRGLLCGNCNKGIGLFAESIDRLRGAIEYLKKFKESKSNG